LRVNFIAAAKFRALCGAGAVKRQEILDQAERNFKTQRNDAARMQDRTASRLICEQNLMRKI